MRDEPGPSCLLREIGDNLGIPKDFLPDFLTSFDIVVVPLRDSVVDGEVVDGDVVSQ